MINIIKKIIPKSIFKRLQPFYHYLLAVLGAVIYNFPSKKLVVIGITGTKGKTTTTEIVNAILEKAGYKTALASTLRFKIGETEKRNLFKMTMPGRFFMQKFLSEAAKAGCTHAVIEMTSEGAKQFRQKFIYLDALIFTNLAKEHIESHGSYENYVKAKLSIAKEMEGLEEKTSIIGPVIVANIDDAEAEKFLSLNIKNKVPYSLSDAVAVKSDESGSSFQIGKIVIHSKLPGIFNVSNMLGAIALAKFLSIPDETIKKALEEIDLVRGRMEKIREGQDFEVVVDYAHTPDSLKAIYETYGNIRKICVLGNTGGGRDIWKRKVMGEIADHYCDQIILTNEDPYDEDPKKILEDIMEGIQNKPCEIVMDRRKAIAKAVSVAKEGDAVLITGKGTDPYIMEANGKKTPWDDATVAREELQKLLSK